MKMGFVPVVNLTEVTKTGKMTLFLCELVQRLINIFFSKMAHISLQICS